MPGLEKYWHTCQKIKNVPRVTQDDNNTMEIPEDSSVTTLGISKEKFRRPLILAKG
jgi:hypothetical protein